MSAQGHRHHECRRLRWTKLSLAMFAAISAFDADGGLHTSFASWPARRTEICTLRRMACDRVSSKTRRSAERDAEIRASSASFPEMSTGPASRARRALLSSPEMGAARLEAELRTLEAVREESVEPSPSEDSDSTALQRRIREVMTKERQEAAAELLQLSVFHQLQQINVPLMGPLSGLARMPQLDLKVLAAKLYSQDAVELVREHVMGVISDWAHLVRDYPLHIARLQLGQVYALSAWFGYSLQRAESRHQLERQFRDELRDGSANSLRAYIASLSPEEAQRALSLSSVEAQTAMTSQVSRIFGDLDALKKEMMQTMREASDEEEAREMLRNAIFTGQVQCVHLTVSDLRHLALEALAFGYLLRASEAKVDLTYELTPTASQSAIVFPGAAKKHPGAIGFYAFGL